MPGNPANDFNRICVIGLGYVGLPTAAVFASRGFQVLGVDINQRAVDLINQGKIHITEPDLDIMVNGAVARGNLRAAPRPERADAFIIAVPTPFTDGHKPDLRHLKDAAAALAPVLEAGNLVILESTSPVGTTENLAGWLADARPDLKFPPAADASGEDGVNLVYSPERVLPGNVLMELVGNDRVVGGLSAACAARATALYGQVINGRCLVTAARTAELVKLAENAYRDINIAFANELSMIGRRLGIDAWEAIELANHHPRVNILQPGPGVGGHCIAVDPWFIVDSAPEEARLIRTAREVNDGKPAAVIADIQAAAARQPGAVACLGLAYKADIDDLRESPPIDIVAGLAAAGLGPLLVVEPHIDALPEKLAGFDGVELSELDDALDQAATVVLLTDHRPFRDLAPERLQGRQVVDTRGAWRRKP